MSRKNAKSQLRLDQLYFSPCEINDAKVDKEPEGEGEGRVKKEIRKSLLKLACAASELNPAQAN